MSTRSSFALGITLSCSMSLFKRVNYEIDISRSRKQSNHYKIIVSKVLTIAILVRNWAYVPFARENNEHRGDNRLKMDTKRERWGRAGRQKKNMSFLLSITNTMRSNNFTFPVNVGVAIVCEFWIANDTDRANSSVNSGRWIFIEFISQNEAVCAEQFEGEKEWEIWKNAGTYQPTWLDREFTIIIHRSLKC